MQEVTGFESSVATNPSSTLSLIALLLGTVRHLLTTRSVIGLSGGSARVHRSRQSKDR